MPICLMRSYLHLDYHFLELWDILLRNCHYPHFMWKLLGELSSSCVHPSYSVGCFSLAILRSLCCSVILNYRVYEVLLLTFQSKSYVVESPYGYCFVNPGSGLNYAQELVMGEM